MIERIVSVTIFLLLVLLLRAVFYDRLSKRVCYAMWFVVGVYLLVPLAGFSNSFQILNVVYQAADQESSSGMETDELGQEYLQSDFDPGLEKTGQKEKILSQYSDIDDMGQGPEQDQNNTANQFFPESIAALSAGHTIGGQVNWLWIRGVWILGCVVCAMVFAGSNIHFARKLQKSRKVAGHGCIPVYETHEISTPCLFGVIHPAVYLPAGQMEPGVCDYVLAHEYTHYRHGDHVWSVFRCLCVSLYWYHPLVWLAAFLSGRDSEFACDESVIRTFDTGKRKAYGEALILFGTGGKDGMRLFTGSTGMNGSDQELKKRITLIAAQGRQHVGTAVLVCVLLLGVTGCTIGNPADGKVESESDGISESGGEDENTKEVTKVESGDLQIEYSTDLVPEPVNFAGFLDKTEESGVAYFNVVTEKDMPLPLNEWAKINIFTEQGKAIDAYIRFTQVIRDVTRVEEHINHYVEVSKIKEPFGMPSTDNAQYVVLQYEILISGDAQIEENDRIPSMALDHPLRLYSTLESGRFTIQGIERSVCDISIAGQESMNPGDTIQKEVICYIPAGYTAYGIEIAYMTAQRTTNMVYFKPEYEESKGIE